MSALRLDVEGIQEVRVGTARLHVSDPRSRLRSVAFSITGTDGVRGAPVRPDRSVPRLGFYEKDVELAVEGLVRVQPVATLADGSTLEGEEVAFASRGVEPGPGTFESLRLAAAPGRVEVRVAVGSAKLWRCWLRRGAWPTTDGAADGELLDDFLRFEGDAALTWFDTGIVAAGVWYAVAVGYNSAGEPESRATASVQVAH